MKVAVSIILLCLAAVFAQDANDCISIPTCKECIAHNLCGWCAVPVMYQDGNLGPRCAGKPKDPSHPPPGWKPWTCPKDYQNQRCYGYLCDPTNYQCVSAGSSGGGIPLQECITGCLPPTYECNTTIAQCLKVQPGHGTDLPDCQRECQKTTTTTGSTGSTGTTGTTGTTGGNHPQPSGYQCDPATLTCKQVASGGSPLEQCNSNCKNVTPIFVVGQYRGLEIDHKFVKGEWQAKITQDAIVVVDPTGKTWAKGVVRQSNNELWLVTPEGTRRGIFGLQELPEVTVLTWAMGQVGGAVPTSFDDGLVNGATFVFAKCITGDHCKWHLFQALTKLKVQQEKWVSKQIGLIDPVNDPCSKYPDCHSCIAAPEWCGWCSVPVLYNSTILGKNCAGLNTTITPRINCTGTFSTEDCTHATTSASTGTSSTGQTTGGPAKKFYCDPITNTCKQSDNGTLPNDVCVAQCTMVPIVPIVLQDKYFRGLEIDLTYQQGEWRAHFSKIDVTVVYPDGTVIQGNVTTTAQYLTIHLPNKDTIQTIWQFQPGPAVNNLSWAWGARNGPPPTSFDTAMMTAGQSEYWFVACHDGADRNVCDFSK